MDIIKINDCELPIIKKESHVFSYSLQGAKYSFIKDGIYEVLHIDTEFIYETNYYFNLYDSKGNIFKEDKHREIEHINKKESVNNISLYGGNNIILFLNNEFRLLTINNRSINTIDEVSSFNHVLNSSYKTYTDAHYNKIYSKLDFLPKYSIIKGHSREIYGLLSREDIQMTYRELKDKIKKSKKLYKGETHFDIDKDFENMENEIVKAISKYLMLTPKQYKASRFNLINQLNKRLNYNINNKK